MAQIKVNQYSIPDDAITLAKMASGTDGNIITYDASGNPAVVASGTAGHFLKSQGADTVPVFAAAGGGKIGQVVMGSNETQVYSTSSSDDLVSQAITPSANSSSVLVTGCLMLGTNSNPNGGIVLYRDSTALGATSGQYSGAVGSFWSSDDFAGNEYSIFSLNFTFLDTGISTTSATTYKFSTSSFSVLYLNRPFNAASNGYARSTITLMEVLA